MLRALSLAVVAVVVAVVGCSSFKGETPETGNASSSSSSTGGPPAAVIATSLTAGRDHACALHAGKVACWGDNKNGALGVAAEGDSDCTPVTPRCRPKPADIPALSGVRQVSAGDQFACAVGEDAKVLCWGSAADGRLGIAEAATFRATPTVVPGLPPAIEVVAGLANACARVQENGTTRVYCWGSDQHGINGRAPAATARPEPGALPELDGAKAIAMTTTAPPTACAILADDTVWCWGSTSGGAAGLPTASDPKCGPFPCNEKPRATKEKAEAIAVGLGFVCALRGGKVRCWGWDQFGALAKGGEAPIFAPDQPDASDVPGLDNVTALAGRDTHVCALRGGEIWCWGANSAGQLGNFDGVDCAATNRCVRTPTRIPLVTKATAIAVGAHNTFAVVDGAVVAWGKNAPALLGHKPGEEGDETSSCKGETLRCNSRGTPVTLP